MSARFVPVFIDTLTDSQTTKRFGESFGSYPVLRVHNLQGRDIAGRINTNLSAGIVPAAEVVEQMARGLKAFEAEKPK
jgi:hypothetical protein